MGEGLQNTWESPGASCAFMKLDASSTHPLVSMERARHNSSIMSPPSSLSNSRIEQQDRQLHKVMVTLPN